MNFGNECQALTVPRVCVSVGMCLRDRERVRDRETGRDVYVCVCVCVCVTERERQTDRRTERDREQSIKAKSSFIGSMPNMTGHMPTDIAEG